MGVGEVDQFREVQRSSKVVDQPVDHLKTPEKTGWEPPLGVKIGRYWIRTSDPRGVNTVL